jgi:predicted Zn finger-like uncharacterized protein
MTLATTCPQCKTSFKVVPDQLKLRRGLVRCGMCQHVFSGIDYISQVLPPPVKASSSPSSPQVLTGTPGPTAESGPADNQEALNTAFFIPDTVLAPTTQMMTTAFEKQQQPVDASSPSKPPRSIALREDEKLLRRGGPKSALFDAADDQEPDAINFFSGVDPRQKLRGFNSPMDVFIAIGCVLLGVLLGLQLLITGRHSLSASFPGLAPTIEFVAGAAGLSVEPPLSINGLTIESFELQAASTPSIYALSATLKNSANFVVRWPAIELVLTDSTGQVLLKKVLSPNQYLTTASNSQLTVTERAGFKANGEFPLKLALEVSDMNPSGFSASLFYP